MDTLAQLSDVEDRYDGTIATADQPRVLKKLADASAVVRRFTRQQFTKSQTTERIRPVGYKLKLPQAPVVSVDSVAIVDVLQQGNLLPLPIAAWLWDGGQEIWLGMGAVINLAEDVVDWFRTSTPLISVTYTHGYDTVPDVVVAVVCSMVIRTLDVPGSTAMQSQTVGPFGYRLSQAAQDGIMALSSSEQTLLRDFRRQGATMELR